MYMLGLEKAEEPEIKLPTFGSQQTVENSSSDGNARPPICFLRNLYADQETTVRTRHGIMDWLQIEKGVCQGCILSPCLFNVYAEYIMRNSGLDEVQAGIKIAERNINNISDMQMTPPLWQKVKKNKEPLDESERGE